MGKKLLVEKVYESIAAVLPITAIVLVLSVSIAPLSPGTWTLFFFGALMLIFGMGFFTLGAEMSMIPMGEGIGVLLSKSKKHAIPLVVCFVLGVVITIAEPDLTVLANQVPSIPNMVLILTVAVGVGLFLMLAQIRIYKRIPLSYLLVIFYAVIFVLAFVIPDNFVAVSFDSGGVTTGPITVPFIMALGIGMASVRTDKNSSTDSFGLTALCSVGPILAVMILGICFRPEDAAYTPVPLVELDTTKAVAREFARAFPHYAEEVAVALIPVILMFVVYQLISKRFHKHQLIRVVLGLVYTYGGLVMFLTGVNVGFMPAGQFIGQTIAGAAGVQKFLLIPIGALIGYFIVKAEPAVRVLTKQVEEITNGSISQKAIGTALSIGIALSVGLAMLRILTGLNIMYFLVPGYVLALVMTFFVPQIFTGIAFDSGGVASGPMTTTFLLPLAMGACEAVGGNILTDAFGIVAMVAMTPLFTIQLLGLYSKIKKKLAKSQQIALEELDDCIVFFDEV
ncbi:MAG: DUF1538 domain-containing protein [Lachnospiraceae bacterium]|nr:DUF1538 domain-containing protein [Lachnospiraceae bacterium]